MSNQAHPDKLMAGQNNVKETDVRYYDVRENENFDLYGFYNPRTEPVFKRLPDEIGLNVNSGVASLYLNTAGGRVRFSTDSEYVVIRAFLPKTCRFDHMPLTGTSGFDLYVDDEATHRSTYFGTFRPPMDMTDGYVQILKFKTRELRHLTVNFPLYNKVDALEIGLQEDATVGHGLPYANELPVVFYGSSITQGGCASRPGNCYENMIARRLDMDYINLGFSGSGRAEDLIVDYMKNMKMSAFVSDYDHNAPNPQYLAETHYKMYRAIRDANPTLPYVMISRPDCIKSPEDTANRREVIFETYRRARAEGDRNVYYIDGEGFFKGEWEDCCTVDGTHPTDLGFHFMADSIGNTLKKLKLS